VAVDAWQTHPSVGPASPGQPDKLTPRVLRYAGVSLDRGVKVTRYTSDFRELRSENNLEAFQFCLTDARGRWVTYGDATGVQGFGSAEGETCVFTGKPLPQAPFDPRRFAQFIDTTLHSRADVNDGPGSLLVWNNTTVGNNPKMTALVKRSLPDGWKTSPVNQRGYVAHQYCLTAPGGEWYYVHIRDVERYGDTGTCRLDPNMRMQN
jgi:hypothetical protein